MEDTKDYKTLYQDEVKKVTALEKRLTWAEHKLNSFEGPGKAKLYYSLNRQQNDLADMLNAVNLKDLDLEDKNNKTFERLKIIWASVTPLVETTRTLADSAGITGDEVKDTQVKRGSTFLDETLNS